MAEAHKRGSEKEIPARSTHTTEGGENCEGHSGSSYVENGDEHSGTMPRDGMTSEGEDGNQAKVDQKVFQYSLTNGTDSLTTFQHTQCSSDRSRPPKSRSSHWWLLA